MHWELTHGAHAAYSVRADECHLEERRNHWLARLHPQRLWKVPIQSHGIEIGLVNVGNIGMGVHADGLVTVDESVGIGVMGSDCPGLAIVAPDGTLGVAHCGWRGVAGRIVEKLVGKLSGHAGSDIEKWQALIGPGICQNCYEIDDPVISARSWSKRALRLKEGGKANLSLAMAIEDDLWALGLSKIIQSGICTSCDKQLHSYRRDGRKGNQTLALWRD